MSDEELVRRITDYLSGGGLFNPELAHHDRVRDLLIDCRARLSARGGELPGDWQHAAIRIGEELADTGPAGYYDFTSEQWRDWALDAAIKLRAAAGGTIPPAPGRPE